MLHPIKPQSWQHIESIQTACYPQLPPESLVCLQSKWRLSPETCFVFMQNEEIVGYCLAHPWQRQLPPDLNTKVSARPAYDCLYLHDIAILPKARKRGLAELTLQTLKQQATTLSLAHLALVSIPEAQQYWRNQGFLSLDISKELSPYGPNSQYMELALPQSI
ncbi:GNAT family N-acetyltransferase [Shewanella gelidii]|nr:GNAT family N-acetyltransferase [Shewanella gelidii]MCL1096788.1 GNAT family N-acetyltransferase [Shewanella gelidii]